MTFVASPSQSRRHPPSALASSEIDTRESSRLGSLERDPTSPEHTWRGGSCVAAPGATQRRLGLLNVKKEPHEDMVIQPGCTLPFKDGISVFSQKP